MIDNKDSPNVFDITDHEFKKLCSIGIYYEKKYQSPLITKDDLLHDTYVAVAEGRRNKKDDEDQFEFLVKTIKSIANNTIRKKDNNNYNLDKVDDIGVNEDASLEIDMQIVLNEIKKNDDKMFEIARAMIVDEVTEPRKLAEMFNRKINDISYMKKKIKGVAKKVFNR